MLQRAWQRDSATVGYHVALLAWLRLVARLSSSWIPTANAACYGGHRTMRRNFLLALNLLALDMSAVSGDHRLQAADLALRTWRGCVNAGYSFKNDFS